MPDLLESMGLTVEEFERLPFQDAIAWLREKVPLPTDAWDQLAQEWRDYAFTVAGVTRAQLLDDIQQQLLKAMADGTGIEQWKRDFKTLATAQGWTTDSRSFTPWRVELIMQQNFRNAYAAGRWAQINDPVVAKNRPYLMWRHRDSRHPRPAHLALDGKVFPLSDPLWKVCYPPNGFGCRCTAFTVSDRELQEMGITPESFPAERVTLRDRITGETTQVPAMRDDNGSLQPIVDPGFAWTPGASPKNAQWIEQAIARLPDYLQQQVQQDIA